MDARLRGNDERENQIPTCAGMTKGEAGMTKWERE